MTPQSLALVRVIVQSRTGVVIDPDRQYLIQHSLAAVARREGFDSVEALLAAIRVQREARLMWAVADAMSPTESAFFRDGIPFNQFRDVLLPSLAAAGQPGPIKVWSAGCGAGEEPYSLAMIIDAEQDKYPSNPVEIYASDLSDRCLAKAQAGIYTQADIQRGLPARYLVQHFTKRDEFWHLSVSIRRRVRWRRLNLIADLGSVGRFDVVFCRYVLEAFDGPTRKKVLEQLAGVLNPNGYLVLGDTETVLGLTQIFQPVPGQRGVFMRCWQEAVAA
jgi:chemotaxis protein methyltransferase CheR